MGAQRPWYQQPVAVYDRAYRAWRGLDRPTAAVAPALRIETRRARLTIRIGARTLARRGDHIGVLHLDNARVTGLHRDGLSATAIGFEFRRLLVESLEKLAAEARDGGRFAELSAFTAVTIFHRGLRRLGFEPASVRLVCARMTARYQRALLASLHPDGGLRLRSTLSTRAERLWISREGLLARYGARPMHAPADYAAGGQTAERTRKA